MKLYSKNQMVAVTAAAIIVAGAVGAAIPSIYNKLRTDTTGKTQSQTSMYNSTVKNDETVESLPKSEEYVTLEQNVPEAKSAALTGDEAYTQDELQNINVYAKCSGAVVNINTQVTGINWFLEPVVEDGGSGSGSIIDKRGYVLTNVHVIANATKIYVSLSDGTQYEAQIVGQDTDSDLAIIKFTPPAGTMLQTIPFGDSAKLKVGQKVIAIGNPFGFERTMTTGIVSALNRPIKNSNNRIIRNMIQTDTAINPGNSGGPLLDTAGRMVGINTMIYSSSGSSAGVGFCVPAETAVRVAADLLKYGKVRRGVIQCSLVQLNNTIAQYAGLDIARGVLVSRTAKGGNAEKAGIVQGTTAARYGSSIIYLGGDIITQIDSIEVASIADYYSALESKRPGDTVSVKVRRNGKDRTLTVTLTDADSEERSPQPSRRSRTWQL